MKTIKQLFSFMRQHGHPVVWLCLFGALYQVNYYYQRTPSIPFQAFCYPENERDPSRPAKVGMSYKFLEGVKASLSLHGYVYREVKEDNTNWLLGDIKRGQILVAPIDYNDAHPMIRATVDGIIKSRGLRRGMYFIDGKYVTINDEYSIQCLDLNTEGNIL